MCPMTSLCIWLLEENLSYDLNKITNIILLSIKFLLSYIVKDIYILLGLKSSWENHNDLLTTFLAPRLLNGLPSHLPFSLYNSVLWSQVSQGHNGLSITKEEKSHMFHVPNKAFHRLILIKFFQTHHLYFTGTALYVCKNPHIINVSYLYLKSTSLLPNW